MNIFVLDCNPFNAAAHHCDKHVVKMILEYAQLLSTAHRVSDGKPAEWVVQNPDTHKLKRITERLLAHEGPARPVWREAQHVGDPEKYVPGKFELVIENQLCYRTAHVNHPCSIWARETDCNYHWLFQLLQGTMREYSKRYGRHHAVGKHMGFLEHAPRNIKRATLTPFVQAMPDEYRHEDPVEAYHRFYASAKARFARWTEPATVPNWFTRKIGTQDATPFHRPAAMDRRAPVHSGQGASQAAS